MALVQAAENHGNEWGMTWYWWWEIYTSTTNSQNSVAAAAIAPTLKISSHATSLKLSQRLSQ